MGEWLTTPQAMLGAARWMRSCSNVSQTEGSPELQVMRHSMGSCWRLRLSSIDSFPQLSSDFSHSAFKREVSRHIAAIGILTNACILERQLVSWSPVKPRLTELLVFVSACPVNKLVSS